jgi:hypothetical protein
MGESAGGRSEDTSRRKAGHIDIPVRKGIRREYPPASPTSPTHAMVDWDTSPPSLDPHPW